MVIFVVILFRIRASVENSLRYTWHETFLLVEEIYNSFNQGITLLIPMQTDFHFYFFV